MKPLISLIAILGCLTSLNAQETSKIYKHSLSLNFENAFTDLRPIFQPTQTALLFVPGLEYRLRLNQRIALRVGASFRPLQSWELGVLGSSLYTRATFRGVNLNSGIQVHFWKEDYLPQFQMYALIEGGASWFEDEFWVINDAATPRESLNSSVV
ncbi:MAG: hypothetical protein AB8H47_21895 [Bacteroidia bacterium]